jgi:hypothetical protein
MGALARFRASDKMRTAMDGAPAFARQVGTLYVRKSAMPGGKIPKTLIVTLAGE